MLRSSLFCSILLLAGCIGSPGPMLGIMSPDSIDARYLRIRNFSTGYVAVRIFAPGVKPLVTPLLPPGAEAIHEMVAQFGTLCPASLRVEMAAYSRVNPQLSALEDDAVEAAPFASFSVELMASQHYGCSADVDWVNLDSMIDCVVLEVDESAKAIGFQAGWLPPQRREGLAVADPPVPTPPAVFPLDGRLVNQLNQPLPNVEIRFPQFGAGVFTDAQGRFRVLRPAGTYVIEPVLPGIEISPMLRSFSHFSSDEVPIEFIALTESTSIPPQAEE